MAIVASNLYSGRVITGDSGYPSGKAQDIVNGEKGTGTPLRASWVNDQWGFLQALLDAANITPSGTPDQVGQSDYLDAVNKLIREPLALKIFQSPSSEGLTEIQTRTVEGDEVYEVRKTSDNSLATIYSDAAGTTEIVQNGTSNVSDSAGAVEFFIENIFDELKIVVGANSAKFKNNVFIQQNTKTITVNVGATTAEIQSLLNEGYKVIMPAGSVGDGGTLSPPSGSVLIGSGAPRYNDTVVSGWDDFGTLVTFEIDISHSSSGVIGNFSIDSPTDGIRGYYKDCGQWYIKSVNTKAVTHGHIYALFLSAAEKTGSADPANNVIGNIVVEGCEHWGGANGFITKHDRVTFVNCRAHSCTTQGFACAADNINGAQVFHTARFNKFIDCEAIDCFISFKNYSRDEFSSDGIAGVNTNGVIPSYDTQFIRCNTINSTVYPFLIGDDPVTANATRAILTPELVKIDGLPYSAAAPGFIRIERVKDCLITGCEFKDGNNVRSIAEFTSGLIIDESNSVTSTSTGDEVSSITISSNATSIKLHKWCPNQRVIFNNTLNTTINSVSSAVDNKPYDFIIREDFTKLFIFGGQGYLGNGVRVKSRRVNSVWDVISPVGSTRSTIPAETILTGAKTISIDLLANRSNYFFCSIDTVINGISVANLSSIPNGDIFTLEIIGDGTNRAIGGFSSIFIFNGSAPTQVTANNTLQLRFMKINSNSVDRLIEVSRHEYVTP